METATIMKFEEFQQLARLYVIGALDPEELELFRCARELFGPRAEAFIDSCRKLGTALALSLEPMEPRPETKRKLMERIFEEARERDKEGPAPVRPEEVNATDAFLVEREKTGRRRC